MRSMSSEKMHGFYDPSIAELKRDVVRRLQKARSEGVSAGKIAEIGGEGISIYVIYDMLNAEIFPEQTWRDMDAALKYLGY